MLLDFFLAKPLSGFNLPWKVVIRFNHFLFKLVQFFFVILLNSAGQKQVLLLTKYPMFLVKSNYSVLYSKDVRLAILNKIQVLFLVPRCVFFKYSLHYDLIFF